MSITPWFEIGDIVFDLRLISRADMDQLCDPEGSHAHLVGYPSFYDDSDPPRVWPLPGPGIRVAGLP